MVSVIQVTDDPLLGCAAGTMQAIEALHSGDCLRAAAWFASTGCSAWGCLSSAFGQPSAEESGVDLTAIGLDL